VSIKLNTSATMGGGGRGTRVPHALL